MVSQPLSQFSILSHWQDGGLLCPPFVRRVTSEKTVSQSGSQSVSQPVSQSVSQPASQSVNQSVSQSMYLEIKVLGPSQ